MSNLSDSSTEEKILTAAKTIFVKYGLYGARMQDIADTAGINKALLHYYFRSKEKLFNKVFDGALVKYFQQMDVFCDSSLPIQDQINKYIDNLVDFYEEYPQMSMFIIKEMSINPEMFKQKVAVAKQTKGVSFINILENAIAKGEIKLMDTAMFMVNIQSLCSYPFLASPLFSHVLKANNKNWSDINSEKLKQSVKAFVEHSLNK